LKVTTTPSAKLTTPPFPILRVAAGRSGVTLPFDSRFYDDPSSFNGSVTIQNGSSASATVQVPSNAGGQNLHIILEVRDNGSPVLTAYRRVIVDEQ
jgi:hypothetical protein